MDLQVTDVAKLLNVQETTILKWAETGKIPSYKLKDELRFSRGEIEEWLVRHHGADHAAPQNGLATYNLFRAINKGGIYPRVAGSSKEEVLQHAAHEVGKNLPIDPQTLSNLLIERETLMTTALNEGVAVPHTREIAFTEPFDAVAIIYPTQPIEWNALDGKKVDLLFLLLASDDKRHLNLLAKVAHLSRDPKAIATLRSRPSAPDLLQYIKTWEASLSS